MSYYSKHPDRLVLLVGIAGIAAISLPLLLHPTSFLVQAVAIVADVVGLACLAHALFIEGKSQELRATILKESQELFNSLNELLKTSEQEKQRLYTENQQLREEVQRLKPPEDEA